MAKGKSGHVARSAQLRLFGQQLINPVPWPGHLEGLSVPSVMGEEDDSETVYGPDAMAEILHRIAEEVADDDVTEIFTLAQWCDWLMRKLEFECEQ